MTQRPGHIDARDGVRIQKSQHHRGNHARICHSRVLRGARGKDPDLGVPVAKRLRKRTKDACLMGTAVKKCERDGFTHLVR